MNRVLSHAQAKESFGLHLKVNPMMVQSATIDASLLTDKCPDPYL